MPYLLAPSPLSPSLLVFAQDILEGVKARQFIGLGVIVMQPQQHFFVDAIGEAARNPHLTRAGVLSLDDLLRELVQGKRDSLTTR